jgi:DNA replication protein DnaC
VSATAELTHLFRAMKAPAAARALPNLCERAHSEEWSYERFTEALLSTEIASRDASGGELRIKAARFPARKTLEEFDFTFQRSIKKQVIEPSRYVTRGRGPWRVQGPRLGRFPGTNGEGVSGRGVPSVLSGR